MTIGDLTPNMIGAARIRVTTEDATVEGVLADLRITTDHSKVRAMVSDKLVREVWRVWIDLKVGSVNLYNLTRETPCEVIK